MHQHTKRALTALTAMTLTLLPPTGAHADNRQPLPSGAVVHQGDTCQQQPTAPIGQGCPQRQDTDCTGTTRQIGACMAARRGWFADQYDCLEPMWTHESDWTPTEGNRDGSYGIPQALPGSKLEAGPGDVQVLNPPYRADPYTDVIAQEAWGLRYIADRYGDPCSAWLAWQQHGGWY